MPNSVFYSIAAAAVNCISGFHKQSTKVFSSVFEACSSATEGNFGDVSGFGFFLFGCLTPLGHNTTIASSTNVTF